MIFDAIFYPLSSILDPRSSILDPRSSILDLLSSTSNPPPRGVFSHRVGMLILTPYMLT